MIRFLRAHGADPGPTQRPLTAGLLAGVVSLVPAGGVFIAFGSFAVVADEVLRLPRWFTGALLVGAYALAGLLYGALFQRAANDVRAGWLLGLAYGFLLWVIAPIVVVPLVRGPAMAAGQAATGFLVTFLLWGVFLGALFPWIHRPLHANLEGQGGRAAMGMGRR